jgi:hypothetical protein
LERLIANGWVFTATEQGDAVRGDMIDAAQPLREFIDDGLVLVPERMEDPADDIYAAYRWWAEAVGLGVLDKLSLRRQVVEQWGGEGVTLQRPKPPGTAGPYGDRDVRFVGVFGEKIPPPGGNIPGHAFDGMYSHQGLSHLSHLSHQVLPACVRDQVSNIRSIVHMYYGLDSLCVCRYLYGIGGIYGISAGQSDPTKSP